MIEKSKRKERIDLLRKKIAERILVLDGATGTALQGANLQAKDFGGEELEGCNENLVFTRPDVVRDVHRQYLLAGADIVETNTFGGTPLVLNEYNLGEKAYEINKLAAELARLECAVFDQNNDIHFVAGSIGPTTKAITVTGGIDVDQLAEHFYIQVKGLYDGGADYFLIETCQDSLNIKACLLAIDRLHAEVEIALPVAISVTIEPTGTMLAGQTVDALAASLEYRDLFYIGLNCATGPEFMTDHIRTLAEMVRWPVACLPNAGLPDADGNYLETPNMMGTVIERFIEKGWINVIGGCCGTTSAHIKVFREIADKYKPRIASPVSCSRLSGIEYLEVSEEKRPILVGERTNIIGSKKFKDLIIAEKWEEASEVARAQVKGGAAVIDICLANPDRNELSDLLQFLPHVTKKIKAPIMIDSTDAQVIEAALKMIQGKAIINSVNLEDGEERFEQVLPLVHRYGAAVVVGTIDDDPVQGMGVQRERKLAIADREYELLTKKYHIQPEDIYWDALVFPCGTGDAQYIGSAPETIEAIRLLKQKYPQTKTVLGISNISFGLPPAGREVLNSVFLYHCTQAGLDLAIVNSEKIQRYASLSKEEIEVCDRLLWNRGDDPIAEFTSFFRAKKPKVVGADKQKLSLDERLANYIVEGTKEGLIPDLDKKLSEATPLEIINGPLMRGMDIVGKLFNNNQLIVAEVLQSAEVMKASVAHLEKFIEKKESSLRGKVILATVKGDVHDIGKNLVEIILSNNGFEVINLGIKIPSEQLIQAVREHNPVILGLSGLLVKSAQQMEISAGDLAAAGVRVPLLVGGAALSQVFTDRRIAKAYGESFVTYAKDAMNGLDLAKQIVDAQEFSKLQENVKQRQKNEQEKASIARPIVQTETVLKNKSVSNLDHVPQAPDWNKHIVKNIPLEQLWQYINPLMLYGRHLGIPGALLKAQERNDKKTILEHPSGKKFLELYDVVESLKKEVKSFMLPQGVYQFFKACSDGNTMYIYSNSAKSSSEKEIAKITFPRQNKDEQLCIADYIVPKELVAKIGMDSIAIFCVTAGKGIREKANQWKEHGHYVKSHALSALTLETAEAFAEYLHGFIRSQWGFPDSPDLTMMERFQAKYRGCRYSFGYPACPRLEDQRILFDLLRPEDIGVELTEEFMMDPEASVSAIVIHHPEAKYFSVGSGTN